METLEQKKCNARWYNFKTLLFKNKHHPSVSPVTTQVAVTAASTWTTRKTMVWKASSTGDLASLEPGGNVLFLSVWRSKTRTGKQSCQGQTSGPSQVAGWLLIYSWLCFVLHVLVWLVNRPGVVGAVLQTLSRSCHRCGQFDIGVTIFVWWLATPLN